MKTRQNSFAGGSRGGGGVACFHSRGGGGGGGGAGFQKKIESFADLIFSSTKF